MPIVRFPKLRQIFLTPLFLTPLLVAFGSGILMSLAAAPLNWWGLAWVALAPLWAVMQKSEVRSQKAEKVRMTNDERQLITPPTSLPLHPSHSLLPALLWGIGYHGLTLSWILGLHPLTWLGVPWLASVAIALFCWGFITLWGTATTVLWAWAMSLLLRSPSFIPHPFQRVLIGTALWCGLEWLLSLTPLSWTSLAFTQSPGNVVILHLGRLSGSLMVTAAIVATNGLLATAWLSHRQRNREWEVGGEEWKDAETRRRGDSKEIQPSALNALYSLLTIAFLLVTTAHAIGFGLYRQPLADAQNSTITVGIVQGNIPTREKLSGAGVERAIDRYVSGYETLASAGVDVVLTPEGSLPFLWNPARNPLYQAVLERRVAAWLGIFVAENGRITQSLLSIAGDGSVVGRYNKIKLVPLGEYIPFQETLGRLIGRLSPIEANMLPGRSDQRFETPFGRAIASICYESVFPELFRAQAAAGGQFIVTASNLDPYSQVLMAQHQAHDLMRTIELDRWTVRATNTGYSGVIDPHGRIVWRSQPNRYEIGATQIERRQTMTPYVRWGDWSTPALLVIAAIIVGSQGWQSRNI